MNGSTELLAQLRNRLLPQPRSMHLTGGALPWQGAPFALQLQGAWTSGAHHAVEAALAQFLSANAVAGTAVPLRVFCRGKDIDLEAQQPLTGPLFSAAYATLGSQGNERYELSVTPGEVLLSADTQIGVLRGIQTLTQLLTHARAMSLQELPCLQIQDEPAMAWRGLLLDVARHFIELPALLRTLEGMAHHKMNVLHLHLTDDQAFRFPSAAFPKLNASGASYSIEELKTLVSRANALGIRVVPELDMPGHTTSWLAAYPEWSLFEVGQTDRFGVHPGCLNPTAESTYDVIGQLLAEFAEVFPDECVHVGGDEVHPRWWAEHPEVQAFMAREGLAEPRDLQAYFNNRVAKLLTQNGKRMLVWDEAVHETLSKEVVVQAWRGMTARDAALQQGHQCIVSAPYYLDLFYPADLHTMFAPAQPLASAIELEDAMLADVRLEHVAGGLEWTKQWRDRPLDRDETEAGDVQSQRRRANQLLGAEACLWSELVDEALLDVRLWSRLPLLAEMFWRGESLPQRDYTRIAHSLLSWSSCGGPDLRRALGGGLSQDQLDLLAPAGVSADLTDLLVLLEPSKWYSRLLGAKALAARLAGSEMPQARPYGTQTSLRSIADVISPQSFVAAQFSELLGQWRQAALNETQRSTLAAWIAQWERQEDLLTGPDEQDLAETDQIRSELLGLARRLRLFARLLSVVSETCAGQPLQAQALASCSINVRELKRWYAPVGELMLAPVGAFLENLERPDVIGHRLS